MLTLNENSSNRKRRFAEAQLEADLRRLYENGESTYSIAEKISVSAETVRRHLKKLGVKLRCRREAMKLAFEKGRKKPPTMPHQVLPTSLKLTPEKAYILGVLAGDGFLVYCGEGKPYRMYKVALETVDEEFADEFRRCLYLIYGIMPTIRKIVEKHPGRKDRYHVAIHCKAACEDLLKYGSFGTRKWNVPEDVKSAPLDMKASYLRGFFDSEGGVDTKGWVIYAASVCAQGLYGISMLLSDFGTIARIKQPLGKNYHVLKIYGRLPISLFAKHVGFTINRKKEALKQLLANYRRFITSPNEVLKLEPEMWRLRGLGLTYREIAEKLNLGYRTVWRHLNESKNDMAYDVFVPSEQYYKTW